MTSSMMIFSATGVERADRLARNTAIPNAISTLRLLHERDRNSRRIQPACLLRPRCHVVERYGRRPTGTLPPRWVDGTNRSPTRCSTRTSTPMTHTLLLRTVAVGLLFAWNRPAGSGRSGRRAGRGGGVIRPRHVLFEQGHPRRRDRRHVRLAADDDAQRPARPHSLPASSAGHRLLRTRVVHDLEPLVANVIRADPRPHRPRRGGAAVVDVTAELAVPLPVQLIATLLGLPEGDERAPLPLVRGGDPGATDWPAGRERMALLGEMTVELLALAAAARADPPTTSCRCSPPTTRTASRSPTEQSAMFLIQLLVAGNETTRNAISGRWSPSPSTRSSSTGWRRPRPAADAQSRRCCAGPPR